MRPCFLSAYSAHSRAHLLRSLDRLLLFANEPLFVWFTWWWFDGCSLLPCVFTCTVEECLFKQDRYLRSIISTTNMSTVESASTISYNWLQPGTGSRPLRQDAEHENESDSFYGPAKQDQCPGSSLSGCIIIIESAGIILCFFWTISRNGRKNW